MGSGSQFFSLCIRPRGSWSFARENSVASRFPGSRRHLSSCRSRGNCVLGRRTLSHLTRGFSLRPRSLAFSRTLPAVSAKRGDDPLLLFLYFHYYRHRGRALCGVDFHPPTWFCNRFFFLGLLELYRYTGRKRAGNVGVVCEERVRSWRVEYAG